MALLTEEDLDLLERPEHLEQTVDTDSITLKPKQAKFVMSNAPYCAYGGGVGNGKTLAAIIKVHQHCENNPGAYFLVGRKFFPELRDSTMRDFLDLMGSYGTYSAQDKKFIYPNGSEIIFRHLDNRDSLTNLNLSGFYVDQAEDISEETFDYLCGRVRLSFNKKTRTKINERVRIITFNPKGHDWIWRLFDQKKDPDGYDLTHKEDYFLEVATTFENKDNLTEDYLRSLENKSKEWKDRFIYGSFDAKAGRIFEEFNPALHIIPEKYHFQIPDSWLKFRAMDFGLTNPTVCLWVAVDPDNNCYVYREYYRPHASVSQHAEAINRLSKISDGAGHMVEEDYSYTIIDPSAHNKNQSKGDWKFSVADEFMDYGIPTMKAQNDVTAGINRVKEYMMPREKRYHPFLKVEDLVPGHPLLKYNQNGEPGEPAMGSPKLFIFSSCEMLLKEIPEYIYQPLKYNQIGLSNNPDKPVKNFDHAVDALRYAIMSRPVNPFDEEHIDPSIYSNPLQLAIYAKRHGITTNDLLANRFASEGRINHSDKGIKHSSSLEHR